MIDIALLDNGYATLTNVVIQHLLRYCMRDLKDTTQAEICLTVISSVVGSYIIPCQFGYC